MPGPDYTLDFDRMRRVGFPEVVLAEGKTPAQIVEICRQLARAHDVLVTRLTPDTWEEVAATAPLPGRAQYDPRSRTLHLRQQPCRASMRSPSHPGTSDTAVAEEARRALEYLSVSSLFVLTSASQDSCASSRESRRSRQPTP
jgi:NCAIR mutase (PurE)-related protein